MPLGLVVARLKSCQRSVFTCNGIISLLSTGITPDFSIPIHFPFKYWQANEDLMRRTINERNVPSANIDRVLALHKKWSNLRTRVNQLQSQKKRNAKAYNENMKPSTDELVQYKEELQQELRNLNEIENLLYYEAAYIPNISSADSPVGNESNNKIVYENFSDEFPMKDINFSKSHIELNKSLKVFDMTSAAKTAGSRFFYWTGDGVYLEMALIRYALDKAVAKGFLPVQPPEIVRYDFIERCGFQPRYREDETNQSKESDLLPVYRLEREGSDKASPRLGLIGTSEVPLALLHANSKLTEVELPKKYVGISHCFRPETNESHGLYRVHQFSKVELFIVCTPGQSQALYQSLINLEREIFEGLGFTIRQLNMATEELGASAFQKYDMETWMPGLQKWGELSSASHCTDYQSRRLNIRYYESSGKSLEFPFTLNATAISVPRAVITILENGQELDDNGNVRIRLPASLVPYFGKKFIS